MIVCLYVRTYVRKNVGMNCVNLLPIYVCTVLCMNMFVGLRVNICLYRFIKFTS